MSKKVYRSAMSFDKATMTLGNAGVSGKMLSNDTEVVKRALEGFSFFGGSGDTSRYFENVDAENIIPKPEDFIRVPFRLLSATIVGAGTWKATDFTDAQLLKSSLTKLDKKPIFFDHDQDAMNWVGIVTEPTWSEARTQADLHIPAGIDAVLAIDAKTNPKLARGVLIGAIMSNSVTVVFDWVKSHEDMSDGDFYNKMGTVVGGKMVTRKATQIYDYYETSLCWLGADPYAKLYGEDGNLRQVDSTAVFVDEPDEVRSRYTKEGKFSAVFGYKKEVFENLSKNLNNNNKNTKAMDKELQVVLCGLLGLSAETAVTKEHFNGMVLLSNAEKVSLDDSKTIADKVTELASKTGEYCNDMTAFLGSHSFVKSDLDVAGLTATQTAFEAVRTELKCEKAEDVLSTVQSLAAEAELGKTALNAKREETKRLYSLSVQNKTDDSVLNLIANAKPEELNGLLKMYTKGATESFSATCKKCGSTEFSFRSSLEDAPKEETEAETVEDISFENIYKKEAKTKFNIAKN